MSNLRTLPSEVSTGSNKKITDPTWLVEIDYPSPDALYLTSGAEITYLGITFDRPGVNVSSIRDLDAAFSVFNDQKTITALVSLHGANDTGVRIWQYYGTAGVLLFEGFLDGCRFPAGRVEFRATRVAAGMASFPERAFTRADFPYMPRGDQEIKFSGATYTLKGRR